MINKIQKISDVKWWEWLIIGLVGFIVLFPKTVISMITQMTINEGSLYGRGNSGRGGFWRFLKKAVQVVLNNVPFGGVATGILDLATGDQWSNGSVGLD